MLKELGKLIFVAIGAVGCAGPTVKDAGTIIERELKDGKVISEKEQRSGYSEYLNKVTEQRPLFEMTCPQDGCKFASLKVNAPSGNSGNNAGIAPPPVEPNAGVAFVQGMFDFGKHILNTGVAVAPWVGITRIVNGLTGPLSVPHSIDQSYHVSDSSNRSVVNTTTTTNTTANTTTVTASGAGSGAASGGPGSGSNAPQTTTSNTAPASP